MSGLVVSEDLVETQDDVCEQERALDRVSFTAANTPGAEEYGAGDCDADQSCINVSDLWKTSNPPKEVH